MRLDSKACIWPCGVCTDASRLLLLFKVTWTLYLIVWCWSCGVSTDASVLWCLYWCSSVLWCLYWWPSVLWCLYWCPLSCGVCTDAPQSCGVCTDAPQSCGVCTDAPQSCGVCTDAPHGVCTDTCKVGTVWCKSFLDGDWKDKRSPRLQDKIAETARQDRRDCRTRSPRLQKLKKTRSPTRQWEFIETARQHGKNTVYREVYGKHCLQRAMRL